jgi:hypothetical protein
MANTTTSTTSVGPISLTITQVFGLQFDPAADSTASALSLSGEFQASCLQSAAYVLGRDVDEIQFISLATLKGRRLDGLALPASASADPIVFRYSILVHNFTQMNATIDATQTVDFAEDFGQKLISAEQISLQGLRITKFSLFRISTESNVRLSALWQSPNRTALGGVLELFGRTGWNIAALQSWAVNAAPAVLAALQTFLSTSMVSPAMIEASVAPGVASVSESHVSVRFDLFIPVPPLERIADDPDGMIYLNRTQHYAMMLANISDSVSFAFLLDEELAVRGMPTLSGLPSGSKTDENLIETAGGQAVPMVIAGVAGLLLTVLASRHLKMRKCHACCLARKKLSRVIPEEHILKSLEAIKGYGDSREKVVDAAEKQICICGQSISPRAEFCCKCGRGRMDIVRELYVESRTPKALAAALKEFEEPPSPTSTVSYCELASELALSSIDQGEGLKDLLRNGTFGASAMTELTGSAAVPELPLNIVVDGFDKDGGFLRRQATVLRPAMGLDSCTHDISSSDLSDSSSVELETETSSVELETETETLSHVRSAMGLDSCTRDISSGGLSDASLVKLESRTLSHVRSAMGLDSCSRDMSSSGLSDASLAKLESGTLPYTSTVKSPSLVDLKSPEKTLIAPIVSASLSSLSASPQTARSARSRSLLSPEELRSRSRYSPDTESSSSDDTEVVDVDTSDGESDRH